MILRPVRLSAPGSPRMRLRGTKKLFCLLVFTSVGWFSKLRGVALPCYRPSSIFFALDLNFCAAKAQGLGERLLHKLHTEAYLYPSFSKKNSILTEAT